MRRWFSMSCLMGCLWVVALATAAADDWPQWRGPQRDGVWRETGILKQIPKEGLEVSWRMPIQAGYSGPTVADDRVFVTDRLVEPEQTERVLCFDAKGGQELWKFSYPCAYAIGYQAGPRACVTVEDNRAFALGAMGHLHCLDAGTGDVLWKRDLNTEFEIHTRSRDTNRMPIWGIAAAPLIYRDLVILQIGARGACIVALDKKSGEEQWRALNDRASYAAPILVEQGGADVAVCWTGDSVAGLNPSDGKVVWRFPFAPQRMPIGIATPVLSGNELFLTSFYDGSLMLRLTKERGVEKVWQRRGQSEQQTDALHSIISTPVFDGEHVYGVDSYGELRCLKASDGERVWEDQTAVPRARWSTIHFVQHESRYWMFNERGELLLGELSPQGFKELGRTRLIEPTREQLRQRGGVCWAHPAFANRHIFIRNDKELIAVSLEEK